MKLHSPAFGPDQLSHRFTKQGELAPGATFEQVQRVIEGHVLATAELPVGYERPRP